MSAGAPPAEAPAAPAPAAEAPWPGSHEETSVMPAWQPEETQAMKPIPMPGAEPPVGVDDTLIMGGAAGAGTAAEAPAAAGGAELKIQGGPDTGHTFRVGEHALRIGRSPDNDLILRDPATSGHHARLERRGEQWFIVDLGSTNGTLVNGEPVQEKELKNQDEIKIGQNVVSFNLL
jgi:hypothetical protein